MICKNNFQKISCLLLAVLILSSVLISCSNEQPTAYNDTSSVTETEITTIPEEETEIVYSAPVPEGTNLNGYEFRIMVNDSSQYWADQNFVHDEENGNYINDAVLRREQKTEELLYCDVLPVPVQSVTSTVQRFVSADENAADQVWISPVSSASLVTNGTFLELNSLDGLDLTAPWWDQNAVADLSISDRLYQMYGDISMMYKRTLSVIVFNKGIAKDLGLSNPYELVQANNWTYETLFSLCKGKSEAKRS